MNLAAEPRLLRCPDLGLMIEFQVGRKWSHVVARDAGHVFVKRVPNNSGKPFDYPKGIAEAARQFLNPALGIAVVTPDAQLILEEIMKVYSTKAAAKKGLERMGGDVSKFDEVCKQNGDKWELDEQKAVPVRVDARSGRTPIGAIKGAEESLGKRPKIKHPPTAQEERRKRMQKGGVPKAPKAPKAPAADRKPVTPRADSKKSHARALFTKMGTGDIPALRAAIVALGVTAGTAASWVGAFKKHGV